MEVTKKEKKLTKVYHYNYTGNVRCNDIKPIERKFFKFIIKQIDYEDIAKNSTYDGYTPVKSIKPIRDLLNYFSNKYHVSYKQLEYYLIKWSRLFYDYGVELDLGCFENLDKLIIEKTITNYSDAVPERVRSKYIRAVKKSRNIVMIDKED